MSDTNFSQYCHYGTNAERLAFTPSPGAGQPIYNWYATDTGLFWVYDTGWHQVSSAGGAPILRASASFTDAQIKALPTTALSIVSAPGAGFMIVPIQYLILVNATAGAYANIHASSTGLIQTTSTHVLMSGYIANDASTTPAQSMMTALFGAAGKRNLTLIPDFSPVTPADGWSIFGDVQVTSDIDNRDLELTVSNTGGDFTGGNAANTLKVITYYTVEAV